MSNSTLHKQLGTITKRNRNYIIYSTVISDSREVSKKLEPFIFSLVPRKKDDPLRLITDPLEIAEQTKKFEPNAKPRCPYCKEIKSGRNVVTNPSVVTRAAGNYPRQIETSRWCPCCGRTWVKGKLVSAVY